MILTRYLGSHLEDILMNCRLKVSKVSKFNDPFEFRYKIVGELRREVAVAFYRRRLENEEFIQQIRNHDQFREKTVSEIKHHFQQNIATIIDNLLSSTPDANKLIIDDVADVGDRTIRIICFSKPIERQLDDILLWSHYTQNHSGFRIWINLSLEALLPIQTCEVNYIDDLLSIDVNDLYSNEDPTPVLRKSMETKATCWKYENEIRAFILKEHCKSENVAGKTLEYIDISLESLIRIDFGIRFPIEERNRLIERMNEKGLSNIEFFQCKPNYDKYAIEYETV